MHIKSVNIQKLEVKKANNYEGTEQHVRQRWIERKCQCAGQSCTCELLVYEENIPANIKTYGNSFYGAFAKAYNNHEDVTISPDDIWTVIMQQFSKHVNDHSEELRSMFVEHEGNKELTVTTWGETAESQWTEFCELMHAAIAKNTSNDIISLVEADFSTTNRVEKLISTMSVMDTFKKYFSYGRCIPCCGINNVHFLGTLDDWEHLPLKLTKLRKYGSVGNWNQYIDNMVPILNNFIKTYKGDVDVDYWNKIMNFKQGRLGSGSTTFVSGWIINFFGFEAGQEVDVGKLPDRFFDVTVKIDNKLTSIIKNVSLIGGFGGVNYSNGSYRPQLSYAVYYDGNKAE